MERIAGPPGHTVWQIHRPRVNQARTDYPQITFTSGSQVTITAGGCVQRGGHGATTYRYVDPTGSGTDKLYFGLISIPGATTGLERFQPVQPTVYTIPAGGGLPANEMHLALGYADDAYADNGYKAPDDGEMKQCWNVPEASVTIDIAPLAPAPATPAERDYDFAIDKVTIRNLRSKETDTDILSMAVTINGTVSAVRSQSLGNLKAGAHSVDSPIHLEQMRPGDRFDIVYTVANAGEGNAQQIDAAITNTVGKLAGAIPVYGQFIALAASIWQQVYNVVHPGCDGMVVAGAVMGTAQDLALWTANGSYTRTLSFPGTDSATGCGANSFYEVTYTISPSAGPRPYAIVVNAPARTFKMRPN